MRAHLLAAGVLVLLGAASSTQGDPKAGPRPVIKDLDALGRILDSLPIRHAALVEQASQDERVAIVQRYAAYQREDFKDTKRFKAKDILDIMFASDADYQLRRAALAALTSDRAKNNDRDLVSEAKPSKRPRAEFSMRHVVPGLSEEKDPTTRALAHEFLVFMHGKPNDQAVLLYDAGNGTKAQWKKAEQAWVRHLRH
jgi:hypothetical protein